MGATLLLETTRMNNHWVQATIHKVTSKDVKPIMNAWQLRAYQATLNNDLVASERNMVEHECMRSIRVYPHQKYTCIFRSLSEATIRSLIADQYKVERGVDSDRGYPYIKISWA